MTIDKAPCKSIARDGAWFRLVTLAIYLKKYEFKENLSYIAFPFEYLPLPPEGATVQMVDRYGEYVCDGTVLRVVKIKRMDRTTVVHVSYPNDYYERVVNMKRLPAS